MTFDDIRRVNEEVNRLPFRHGVDPLWEPIDADDDGGTCTNFSVAKLRRLVKLGFPIESMRLTTCWVNPRKNPLTDYHDTLWVDFEGTTWELSNDLLVQDANMSTFIYDKIQNAVTRKWERA
tara:strand:- start:163 stop:528 length:366 start_codon:yes stop_codon:yes gene_type:complete